MQDSDWRARLADEDGDRFDQQKTLQELPCYGLAKSLERLERAGSSSQRSDGNELAFGAGRIEIGESSVECLRREILEELNVIVTVGSLIDTYLFEVIPSKHVFIATYGCIREGDFVPTISHEHKRIGFSRLRRSRKICRPAIARRSRHGARKCEVRSAQQILDTA